MPIFGFINQGNEKQQLLAKTVAIAASNNQITLITGRALSLIFQVSLREYLKVIYGIFTLWWAYSGTKVDAAIVDKALRCPACLRVPISLFYRLYWYISVSFMRRSPKYCAADCVLTMDDTYGNLLIIDVAMKDGKIVITNFSEFTGGYCLLKNEIVFNQYRNRVNWHFEKPNYFNKADVDNFMGKVISGLSNHKDLSRAHSVNKKIFEVTKKNKLNLLIAGHIFTDASSMHQMDYDSFEDWLTHLLDLISKNQNIEIFVKEHPSYDLFSESGRMEAFLKKWKNINFIPGDLKIKYNDFKVILSNNGTIIYEAIYSGVPCISTSVGFTENLKGVVTLSNRDSIASYFNNLNETKVKTLEQLIATNADWNLAVINDWFLRRKLFDLEASTSEEIVRYGRVLASLLAEFRLSEWSVANVINERPSLFSPKLVYLK